MYNQYFLISLTVLAVIALIAIAFVMRQRRISKKLLEEEQECVVVTCSRGLDYIPPKPENFDEKWEKYDSPAYLRKGVMLLDPFISVM